jgi:hypothetical protein
MTMAAVHQIDEADLLNIAFDIRLSKNDLERIGNARVRRMQLGKMPGQGAVMRELMRQALDREEAGEAKKAARKAR